MKKLIIIAILITMCLAAVAWQYVPTQNDADMAREISNQDLTQDALVQMAQERGYNCDSYEELCEILVNKGVLFYVPAFTYNGQSHGEHYTTEQTFLYNEAKRAGIL